MNNQMYAIRHRKTIVLLMWSTFVVDCDEWINVKKHEKKDIKLDFRLDSRCAGALLPSSTPPLRNTSLVLNHSLSDGQFSIAKQGKSMKYLIIYAKFSVLENFHKFILYSSDPMSVAVIYGYRFPCERFSILVLPKYLQIIQFTVEPSHSSLLAHLMRDIRKSYWTKSQIENMMWASWSINPFSSNNEQQRWLMFIYIALRDTCVLSALKRTIIDEVLVHDLIVSCDLLSLSLSLRQFNFRVYSQRNLFYSPIK